MFSLEKLSFDLIVQKFERFYFAFTVSKDENVHRNFQFLQRRFSVQLATALSVNKKLKDEYFDLLINEHLNLLVGKWFKNSRYLKCMDGIFCRLSNLTKICFEECTDEILENVAKFCPKIVEIDVRCSYVSDDGVKYLCEVRNGDLPCPELKNLLVNFSSVRDRGAECVIRNLSLEKFDYPCLPRLLYSIHKENPRDLENINCDNLVEINLSLDFLLDTRKSYYTDVLETCLAVCPKLESIACYISDMQELKFFTNDHLKKLHLEFSRIKQNINLDNFLKTNRYNLTFLKISFDPRVSLRRSCNISISVLAASCPFLKEFYANNVNFTVDEDNGCVQIIFPSITKCCFSNTSSSDAKAICLLLSSSPKLESFSLRSVWPLSHALKREILMWCKNSSAKLIEFVKIFLEKEFIKDILRNSPFLKAMFLNRCTIDDLNNFKGFLCSFSEEVCSKTRIFVKRYTPDMCDEDVYKEINILRRNSLFKDSGPNLEVSLKEEYRCSNIYDCLFTETVFHNDYPFFDPDWEYDWHIIPY